MPTPGCCAPPPVVHSPAVLKLNDFHRSRDPLQNLLGGGKRVQERPCFIHSATIRLTFSLTT